MRREDYHVLEGLVVAYVVWFVLIIAGIVAMGDPGGILGHIAGVVCAATGIPQRWIWPPPLQD